MAFIGFGEPSKSESISDHKGIHFIGLSFLANWWRWLRVKRYTRTPCIPILVLCAQPLCHHTPMISERRSSCQGRCPARLILRPVAGFIRAVPRRKQSAMRRRPFWLTWAEATVSLAIWQKFNKPQFATVQKGYASLSSDAGVKSSST